MSNLLLILFGFSLGWLACWLLNDGRRYLIVWLSDLADEIDRDYGYDSRTGERSDNEVRMQKPPAPITVRNRRRTGERSDK